MKTVPKFAKAYGVAPKKVIDWILAGELRAINLASCGSTRPRYGIDDEAEQEFKDRRAIGPKPKPVRRRKATTTTKDYFSDL